MNAYPRTNCFGNHQSIGCEDERSSPQASGLRVHVVRALCNEVTVEAEKQGSEHREREESETGTLPPTPRKACRDYRRDHNDQPDKNITRLRKTDL